MCRPPHREIQGCACKGSDTRSPFRCGIKDIKDIPVAPQAYLFKELHIEAIRNNKEPPQKWLVFSATGRGPLSYKGLGRQGLSYRSVASTACLKDEMTLESRGPISLYYESLYGI